MRFMKLVIKNSGLLGCDTALLDHKPLKLWQNVPLKRQAPMTQKMIHHIPQDWNPQV